MSGFRDVCWASPSSHERGVIFFSEHIAMLFDKWYPRAVRKVSPVFDVYLAAVHALTQLQRTNTSTYNAFKALYVLLIASPVRAEGRSSYRAQPGTSVRTPWPPGRPFEKMQRLGHSAQWQASPAMQVFKPQWPPVQLCKRPMHLHSWRPYKAHCRRRTQTHIGPCRPSVIAALPVHRLPLWATELNTQAACREGRGRVDSARAADAGLHRHVEG